MLSSKGSWEIVTSWQDLQPWQKSQRESLIFSCLPKGTSWTTIQSRWSIEGSGWLLTWTISFLTCTTGLLFRILLTGNFGLCCFKRLGPRFTPAINGFKQGFRKKLCMISLGHPSGISTSSEDHLTLNKNGHTSWKPVLWSMQWWHLLRWDQILWKASAALFKATLTLYFRRARFLSRVGSSVWFSCVTLGAKEKDLLLGQIPIRIGPKFPNPKSNELAILTKTMAFSSSPTSSSLKSSN